MNDKIFLSPFALGFYLGCVFLIIAAYNYLRLKGELTRFRRHLSENAPRDGAGIGVLREALSFVRQREAA